MLQYHRTTEAEKHIIAAWKHDGEVVLYTM